MIRTLRSSPRLVLSIVAGIALYILLPGDWRLPTRVIAAWDCATGLYLCLALRMMAKSSMDKIRWRAAQQDDGRIAMLLLTTVAAITSLAAIVAELATAKQGGEHVQWQHIALAALTVFLSWAFLQTIYALHYAHEYYREYDGVAAHGLDFPGQKNPDYWDFMYYSCVIGTAAATADVNILSSKIRKISTVHCIVAFFFNTTILALTVNIGASLF